MADKKEREYVNPKYLLRKIMESLPPELPGELICTVLNLYAHSNGFLEKADVDAGVFTFTVTAPFSQLAKVCHLTPKGMKKRLIRLRDDWHIASWQGKVESNKGNDYGIRWATGVAGVSEGWGTGDAEGGVLENRGGVLEGQGGVLSNTPSGFSGSAGVELSGDKSQRFSKQEDTDQNQKPNPRGFAPNPTGASRPGAPGIDFSWMKTALPPSPDKQPCKGGGLHQWQELTHTTDQCSRCGTFRTNPAVTRWTEADDLEAEYMELVEYYDPYDALWPTSEEPTPRGC
jgi:hypothetical protein